MDYEKKYKDALRQAEEIIKYYKERNRDEAAIEDLQEIFPELKESEDERIRKSIIEFFELQDDNTTYSFIPKKDILAWLEKQGKQKLADKVEPKFHEGDWVVCEFTGSVYQIKNCIENLSNHKYGYDLTNDVYIGSNEVNHYHLWTIKDAKDGDILCCDSGWTCIFKSLNSDNISFSSYCFMDKTTWFCETGSEAHTLEKPFVKAYNGNIHPATKEQRELLFKRMHELGYEWSAEMKELMKIEDVCMFSTDNYTDKERETLCEGCNISCKYNSAAWSEEDEERIKNILSVLDVQVCWDGATLKKMNPYQKEIDWLKSIKQRCTWKPSEEQIEALESAMENCAYSEYQDCLRELIEQLKKL